MSLSVPFCFILCINATLHRSFSKKKSKLLRTVNNLQQTKHHTKSMMYRSIVLQLHLRSCLADPTINIDTAPFILIKNRLGVISYIMVSAKPHRTKHSPEHYRTPHSPKTISYTTLSQGNIVHHSPPMQHRTPHLCNFITFCIIVCYLKQFDIILYYLI